MTDDIIERAQLWSRLQANGAVPEMLPRTSVMEIVSALLDRDAECARLRERLDALRTAAEKHCQAILDTAARHGKFTDQVEFMNLCAAIERSREP